MKSFTESLNEAASGDKEAYQAFFKKALKKFGVDEPDQLSGDKKKEFFDYVDKNWKADNETDIDEAANPFEIYTSVKGWEKASKDLEKALAKAKKMSDKKKAREYMFDVQKKHKKFGATDSEPNTYIRHQLGMIEDNRLDEVNNGLGSFVSQMKKLLKDPKAKKAHRAASSLIMRAQEKGPLAKTAVSAIKKALPGLAKKAGGSWEKKILGMKTMLIEESVNLGKVKKGQKVINTKDGRKGVVYTSAPRGGMIEIKWNDGKYDEFHVDAMDTASGPYKNKYDYEVHEAVELEEGFDLPAMDYNKLKDYKGFQNINIKKMIKKNDFSKFNPTTVQDIILWLNMVAMQWKAGNLKEEVELDEGKMVSVNDVGNAVSSAFNTRIAAKVMGALNTKGKKEVTRDQVSSAMTKMGYSPRQVANVLSNLKEAVAVDMRTKGYREAVKRALLRQEKKAVKKKKDTYEVKNDDVLENDGVSSKPKKEDVTTADVATTPKPLSTIRRKKKKKDY